MFLRFFCVSLMFGWGITASAAAPNFVFIMADDLGWGDVGFHGGVAPTPHLDRLAEQGIQLSQHYVAPVCSPTRAGLLTGRYWSRFGITTPTNERALPPDTVTLPRALQANGYDTCLIGKWHLGSDPQWGPNRYGFDHAYGSLAGGVTAWSHRYKEGPFSQTWHRNGKLIEEQGHVTDLLTREAVGWIEDRGNEPFLLYVPFTAVHLPINEPQPWLDRVPDSITSEIGRQYAACVMHLDDAVGQIVAALDRQGLGDETVVIFTSDNGGSTATNNTQPYPPDDSPAGKLPASNGKLRGQKGTVYEGGTRVPTVIRWSGKLEPRRIETPVCIVDWMPTLCSLAGVKLPEDVRWDGIDLSPLLLEGTPLPARSVYIAGPRRRAFALRSGPWKLVTAGDSEHQLFNIASDPGEQNDVADAEPRKLESMLKTLQQMREGDER